MENVYGSTAKVSKKKVAMAGSISPPKSIPPTTFASPVTVPTAAPGQFFPDRSFSIAEIEASSPKNSPAVAASVSPIGLKAPAIAAFPSVTAVSSPSFAASVLPPPAVTVAASPLPSQVTTKMIEVTTPSHSLETTNEEDEDEVASQDDGEEVIAGLDDGEEVVAGLDDGEDDAHRGNLFAGSGSLSPSLSMAHLHDAAPEFPLSSSPVYPVTSMPAASPSPRNSGAGEALKKPCPEEAGRRKKN